MFPIVTLPMYGNRIKNKTQKFPAEGAKDSPRFAKVCVFMTKK